VRHSCWKAGDEGGSSPIICVGGRWLLALEGPLALRGGVALDPDEGGPVL